MYYVGIDDLIGVYWELSLVYLSFFCIFCGVELVVLDCLFNYFVFGMGLDLIVSVLVVVNL